jgi:hypothetical protein
LLNEDKADAYEVEPDEQATLILARRHPAARWIYVCVVVISFIRDLSASTKRKSREMHIELSGAGVQ